MSINLQVAALDSPWLDQRPTHRHDCDGCVFLGSMRILPTHPRLTTVEAPETFMGYIDRWAEVADLYVCHSDYDGWAHTSLLYRLSGEGSEYHSADLAWVMGLERTTLGSKGDQVTWTFSNLGALAVCDPYFAEALRRYVRLTSREV